MCMQYSNKTMGRLPEQTAGNCLPCPDLEVWARWQVEVPLRHSHLQSESPAWMAAQARLHRVFGRCVPAKHHTTVSFKPSRGDMEHGSISSRHALWATAMVAHMRCRPLRCGDDVRLPTTLHRSCRCNPARGQHAKCSVPGPGSQRSLSRPC